MLDSLGVEELTRRWEQARRLIHDNGVTYNVYGDPQGMQRPWELDAVPLVIAPEEWERLAAALVQRVQVLNALLADVYGPQKLLSTGLLPPELVFAHPDFLRPCHNVRLPQLLSAPLRRRPGAGARRPVVGTRGPHPEPFRGRVCAGKSPRPVAHALRCVSGSPGPTPGVIF